MVYKCVSSPTWLRFYTINTKYTLYESYSNVFENKESALFKILRRQLTIYRHTNFDTAQIYYLITYLLTILFQWNIKSLQIKKLYNSLYNIIIIYKHYYSTHTYYLHSIQQVRIVQVTTNLLVISLLYTDQPCSRNTFNRYS